MLYVLAETTGGTMPQPTHYHTLEPYDNTQPPWTPGMEGVLYCGTNWLAGAPGCGKTWLALIAAKHYLAAMRDDIEEHTQDQREERQHLRTLLAEEFNITHEMLEENRRQRAVHIGDNPPRLQRPGRHFLDLNTNPESAKLYARFQELMERYYDVEQHSAYRNVTYVDTEGNIRSMGGRAAALDFTDAADPRGLMRYTNEVGPHPGADVKIIDTAEGAHCPTMDGVQEWADTHLEEDEFATNIILDHTARAKGSTHPMGAIRKTALADLVIYIDGANIWTRDKPGHIRLIVVKDRHGGTGVAQGEEYARVTATPRDGKLNYQITRNNERHY